MAAVPRQFHQQMIHFLRKSIAYTDGQAAVITVGKIPAGSLILKPLSGVTVNVAYNNGTNNLMHIGTDSNTDLYGTSLSVASIAHVPLDEAVTMLVSSDTTITAEMACSGTAASAGSGEIVIAYCPDTDG
jgi:hypothetical protein